MFYVFSACIQILQLCFSGIQSWLQKDPFIVFQKFAILMQNNNKKSELSGSFLLIFIPKRQNPLVLEVKKWFQRSDSMQIWFRPA